MMHQKSILFLILLFYYGCNQPTESKNIYGCTISSACNFNAAANIFDNSCILYDHEFNPIPLENAIENVEAAGRRYSHTGA